MSRHAPEATLGGLAGQVRDSVRDPQAGARMVLGWHLAPVVLWQALALAVVANTLLVGLTERLVLTADELAQVRSPLATAAIGAGSLLYSIVAAHVVGRAMGGTGRFDGALALVIWLQVVTFCIAVMQVLVLLTFPVLAFPLGLAAVALVAWLSTNFIAVLHGFTSLGKVFAMILVTVATSVLVVVLVLTALGYSAPEPV